MQTPTIFTISPDSQQGNVYGTEFAFTSKLPSDYKSFAWNFGDNVLKYNKSSVNHTYNYPGIYTVGLSAWTDSGELYTDFANINVDYLHRDAILFTKIPRSYSTPGLPTKDAFTVSITSAKIDQPLSIALHASNAKSVPHYAVPEKWKFITPRWRFINASDKSIIEGTVVISSVPVYENSKVVAVKGEASFYYIDDLATGANPIEDCPLIITATLSTERFSYPPESLIYPYASYSNNESTRAAVSWQVNDRIPTKLKVSENFIHDIYPTKWANVPIPVMITCEADSSSFVNVANITNSNNIILSYPRTNEIGALSSVILSLSSNTTQLDKNVHYTVEDNLHFKSIDEYNNVASGYIFTTITPLSPLEGTVVVTASTTVFNQIDNTDPFIFPTGYPIYPEVYISHPSKSTINRINIAAYPPGCPDINYYKDLKVFVEGSISFTTVPTLTTTDLVNYTLSGTAAVYAMAFNPSNDRLYTCDVDQNVISIYSSGTTLLTSVQLSSILGTEVLAPSYISIDKYDNVWVALFDDRRLIKLDANLNYLLSAAPIADTAAGLLTLEEIQNGFVLQESSIFDFISLDVQPGGDTYNSPPIVETDMANNVWACFPDPLNSTLVKFDPEGNELYKPNSFPGNAVPVSLAINATNGVWIACKGTHSIMHYDSGGSYVETVFGFLSPSYIAVDRSNNVWVAHGYDLCSVYNTTTQQINTWKVSTLSQEIIPYGIFTETDIQDSRSKDEMWGGLAVDIYNRIWLIDSVNNVTLMFFPADPTLFQAFNVMPPVDTNYVILPGNDFVSNIPANNVRSAQAGGDWTGNRWYQKYSGLNKAFNINGTSAPFAVYDIDNSFSIAKNNEEFDCAAYFKSLALPEILSQNTSLFDEFFAAVVGDGNPTKESAGRVVYERIANFVTNRGDFETAEIDELLSLAEQMAVEVKTFGSGYPAAVNRLLHMFSIPKHQLRGVPSLVTNVEDNRGELLSITSLVTANTYYLLQNKQYNTQQLLYTNTLDGLTAYPVTSLEVEGLHMPLLDNYYVFEYSEQQTNGYVGNVINWDSPYTNISYSLSTNEEWYGDGGLVETMFNNLLTKQLYQQ